MFCLEVQVLRQDTTSTIKHKQNLWTESDTREQLQRAAVRKLVSSTPYHSLNCHRFVCSSWGSMTQKWFSTIVRFFWNFTELVFHPQWGTPDQDSYQRLLGETRILAWKWPGVHTTSVTRRTWRTRLPVWLKFTPRESHVSVPVTVLLIVFDIHLIILSSTHSVEHH